MEREETPCEARERGGGRLLSLESACRIYAAVSKRRARINSGDQT